MLQDKVSIGIAWGFATGTCVLSVFQICQHLRNYSEPSFQRYIIRIIFLVPSYAIASCLALHYRHNSIYYETPRDCYEAWVIYNFMALCMAYIGGPGAVVVKCEGKTIAPSWMLCTCCMKPIPVDGFFLRRCKQGTLQFVIIKPILAAITLILFIMDMYHVSYWGYNDGYPYIAFIYNVCYAVALFWLLLLYVGTEELLKPYKPLLKFACFKAVIFLTFWQTMVISMIATRFSISPEDAEALQNWIIVAEMFVASIGMLFAFPWGEYQIGGAAKGMSWDAFKHSVSISDVISDIMHQFNPSYGTYVLHTDGGPEKNVKKKIFMGGARSAAKSKDDYSVMTANSDMHLRKPPRRARNSLSGVMNGEGDEEGEKWYSDEKHGLVGRVVGTALGAVHAAQETTHQIAIAIIPHITEEERNQAELLNSDSDADYDEENVRDNQLDDGMLTSSEDGEDHEERGRIATTAALPDSTSRVEAAFAIVTDSTSRVEAAFAAALAANKANIPTNAAAEKAKAGVAAVTEGVAEGKAGKPAAAAKDGTSSAQPRVDPPISSQTENSTGTTNTTGSAGASPRADAAHVQETGSTGEVQHPAISGQPGRGKADSDEQSTGRGASLRHVEDATGLQPSRSSSLQDEDSWVEAEVVGVGEGLQAVAGDARLHEPASRP